MNSIFLRKLGLRKVKYMLKIPRKEAIFTCLTTTMLFFVAQVLYY